MQMPRLRNVLLLKSSLVSSPSTATQFAAIHSTPTLCQKWKKKCNFIILASLWINLAQLIPLFNGTQTLPRYVSVKRPTTCRSYPTLLTAFSHRAHLMGYLDDIKDVKGAQQPSKNYVRYATRRKRADAKKALKDLLYKGGSSKFFLQDERLWKVNGHSDDSQKTQTSNSYARHADKSHQKKIKHKKRRENFADDFDGHPETTFQATFGNRFYTWSFNFGQDPFFQDSTFGFKWREHSSWKNKSERWQACNDEESDDEPSNTSVGSSSDRTILSLPPTGSLRIEDVKKAFHLSALKWHPDKHQGPSQAMAEEKFKLCVNAYKSLCSALSSA